MFGLFQTDIPIGRRLWVMVLVFILAGASTNAISSYSQDPIQFATDLLIYFGYVYVLSFGIAIIPGMIGQIIEQEIDRRRSKEKTYKSTVMPQTSEIWLEIVANLSFIVATYISISSFGSLQILEGGAIGLSLLILVEVFDLNLLYKETPELLEISEATRSKLLARFLGSNSEQKFTLKSDFLTETQKLIEQKWEIVEMSRSKEKSQAVFRRYIRISRLNMSRTHSKE